GCPWASWRTSSARQMRSAPKRLAQSMTSSGRSTAALPTITRSTPLEIRSSMTSGDLMPPPTCSFAPRCAARSTMTSRLANTPSRAPSRSTTCTHDAPSARYFSRSARGEYSYRVSAPKSPWYRRTQRPPRKSIAGINNIGRMISAGSSQSEKVAEEPRPRGCGALRVKLRPPEVAAPHHRRDRFAVVHVSQRHLRRRHRITVHEIEVLARLDPREQRILPRGAQLIPSHVRHRPAGRRLQQPRGARNNTEALRHPLRRALEQQLHPEADAEHRLAQGRQQLREPGALQPLHRICRRSHAGQQDAGGGCYHACIGAHDGLGAQPLERELQRGEIGAAAVDDHGFGHNTPFVLGSSRLSRRSAWRSARPTPLKQASTIWWLFSPVTLT